MIGDKMEKLKTVAFMTLGCKVNSYETDGLVRLFKEDGFEVVGFSDVSDIYIVNTCTVTNLSSRKSRQMLRRAKRVNPESIVIAVGCYSQKEPEKLIQMDEVDIVVGNNNKMKILDYVKEYDGINKKYIIDISEEKYIEDIMINETLDKTRAFIRIQDGCNQFCSYCIIPYVRGRIRSKKLMDVIDEVRDLRDNDYKEIVFTGIHIASYGLDLEENIDLVDVLVEANKIEGIERLRIGSLEPTYLTEENVIRLSKIDKLANHFHLSLQSGSDTVLKRMNRKYLTKEYLKVVQLLREYFVLPAITTDVIVAFPGETDREFIETCEFMDKIKFSQVHVFKYSIREGTKAAIMDNQINGNVASGRSKKLIKITDKLEKEYQRSQINKTHKVLFESFDEKLEICSGLTENYLKVFVNSNIDLTNSYLDVNLETIVNGKIFGEVKRSDNNE
jgi:threonylcarbamoyladenosine tRNA methylthiotransferase MtaB